MKKSLVFVAMLAIALAACGKKEETKPAEAPAAAPAAPATEAPAAAPAADAKK
jgi:predicted small lipoprotein YifL